MTVSSSTNRASYSGNGSLTTFAYGFKVFDQGDLTVILRASNGTETVQTIVTDYTVTGVGDVGGGNVVFGTAPASGVTVVILREMDFEQGLDLVPNDPFPAQSLENSLDKLTFMVQQHDEQLGRAIKASRTNVISGSEFTISAADRANKVFAFDSSGDVSITQEIGVYRGDWAAGVAYNSRDIVKDSGNANIYLANAAHTSSGSLPISSNADTAKWNLIVDAAAAASSAAAAAASETAAQTAQTAAEAAQAAAETAETNAETAETNAETAQAAAEAAQAATEAVYDNFDDRYLGAKSTGGGNPTVDNDGDALIDGALFFDTTNNVTMVYNLGTTTWLRTTPTASDQSNINAVNSDAADIGVVATNISAVTTVATNIADVITVANDLTEAISEVETVANDLNEATSEIEVVANAITNVDLVGGSIASVNTLAAISTDITGVNAISAAVTAVNTNSSNINTVSTDLNGSNNIGLVGAGMANVNLVGGSIANVNVVATNITSVNAFGDQYEVSASEPSSPNEGLLWFDTATDTMKVYNGSSFQNAGSSVNGTSSRGSFTATAGQTSFATTGFDSGYLDVFLNGVKLIDGTDFTATDGTNFVLTTGAALNDTLDYVAYGTFNLANVYTKTVSDARYYTQTASDALYLPLTGGTISTDLIVTGNLTVNGTQTIVNSTTLDVADLNITVANGAADAAAANGAGLTVAGAGATFNYAATGDKWTMNKPLDVTGTVNATAFTGDGSGLTGVGFTTNVVTTSTTATKDNHYYLNGATLTLTLPASPSVGDEVRLSEVAGNTDCLVGRNGSNIMGDASDLTIDSAYLVLSLRYVDATIGWAFS
jgi:hypothetical protein